MTETTEPESKMEVDERDGSDKLASVKNEDMKNHNIDDIQDNDKAEKSNHKIESPVKAAEINRAPESVTENHSNASPVKDTSKLKEGVEKSPSKKTNAEEPANDASFKLNDSKKTSEEDAKEVPEKETPRKREKRAAQTPLKASVTETESSDTFDKQVKPPARKRSKAAAKEETSDEDDHPLKTPLYEAPLTVEGKRERKQVERLSFAATTPQAKELDVPKGSGTKLSEIPFIEHMIEKKKAEDLKSLHRIIYHRSGMHHEIKRNVRQFCGFSYNIGSSDYEKKLKSLEGWTKATLQQVAEVLGLEQRTLKSKDALAKEILDFLVNPTDHGKNVPKAAKKGKSAKSKGKRKRSSVSGGEKKKGEGMQAKTATSEDEKQQSESDESVSSSEEEESDKEPEEPKPRKGKAAATPSKTTPSKEKGSAKAAAATPKKSKFPSDEELKKTIKALLQDADLEKITMNTVCQDVYSKYPSHDLSSKKKFIKDQVKLIIQGSD